MQTQKVHFEKEKETMLITLYGRAMESQSKDPIIRDTAAEEAIQRIDYNFNNLKMSNYQIHNIGARAKVFDDWAEEYLTKNPEAIVLYLGCGLDSRVFRIDPPASVEWFEVDFPETIELRKQLFPKRTKYHMIGSSVTEEAWLDQIPSDNHALILAEGLLYYLTEDEVKILIKRLVNHFPEGQMIFDAFGPFGLRMHRFIQSQKNNSAISAAGARFKWGLNNPHELEEWMPQVKLITELSAADMPDIKKMSWSMRQIISLMNRIPQIRRSAMMLRYQF